MRIEISPALQLAQPELRKNLGHVYDICHWLDDEIDDGIRVSAWCCFEDDLFCGKTYGQVRSVDRRRKAFHKRYHWHKDGRITLQIGRDTSSSDVARLFGHELRHVGQAIRGRGTYGYLTWQYMSRETSEADAYTFEDYVVEEWDKLASKM